MTKIKRKIQEIKGSEIIIRGVIAHDINMNFIKVKLIRTPGHVKHILQCCSSWSFPKQWPFYILPSVLFNPVVCKRTLSAVLCPNFACCCCFMLASTHTSCFQSGNQESNLMFLLWLLQLMSQKKINCEDKE